MIVLNAAALQEHPQIIAPTTELWRLTVLLVLALTLMKETLAMSYKARQKKANLKKDLLCIPFSQAKFFA